MNNNKAIQAQRFYRTKRPLTLYVDPHAWANSRDSQTSQGSTNLPSFASKLEPGSTVFLLSTEGVRCAFGWNWICFMTPNGPGWLALHCENKNELATDLFWGIFEEV